MVINSQLTATVICCFNKSMFLPLLPGIVHIWRLELLTRTAETAWLLGCEHSVPHWWSLLFSCLREVTDVSKAETQMQIWGLKYNQEVNTDSCVFILKHLHFSIFRQKQCIHIYKYVCCVLWMQWFPLWSPLSESVTFDIKFFSLLNT